MASWSRIVNTTIRDYLKGEQVNVMRDRKIPALLKQKGRVSFGHSGDGFDWKIRYKRNPLQGYADTDTLTFSRRDLWKTAFLEWRGYSITNSETKIESLQNRGTEAIVKIYENLTKILMEDAEDQFGDEFYIDGNAAGNEKRLHGIESFLGNSGVSTAVPIATSVDTYATLLTTLGNYGGTWTGNWPVGTGDAEYDFFTPLLVDYTSAITTSSTNIGWSASTKTWANTCVEALRFGILHSQKNKSQKGMLDFIILNDELYRQFLQQLDAKERIVISRGKASGGLQTLGFTDVTNFDGVDITKEYGVPTTRGYGWNFDHMELKSMQEALWVNDGPDYDIASKSTRFSIDMFGQMSFEPRYFVKFDDFS